MLSLLTNHWFYSLFNALCLNLAILLGLWRMEIRHPGKYAVFLLLGSLANAVLPPSFDAYYMPMAILACFTLFCCQHPHGRQRFFICTNAVLLPLCVVVALSLFAFPLSGGQPSGPYYSYIIGGLIPAVVALLVALRRTPLPIPKGKAFHVLLAVEWFIIFMYSWGLYLLADPSIAMVSLVNLLFLLLALVAYILARLIVALQAENKALKSMAVEGAKAKHFILPQILRLAPYVFSGNLPWLQSYFRNNLLQPQTPPKLDLSNVYDAPLHSSLLLAEASARQASIRLEAAIPHPVDPLPRQVSADATAVVDELIANALKHTAKGSANHCRVVILPVGLGRQGIAVEIANPVGSGFDVRDIASKMQAQPGVNGLALVYQKLDDFNVPGWDMRLNHFVQQAQWASGQITPALTFQLFITGPNQSLRHRRGNKQ